MIKSTILFFQFFTGINIPIAIDQPEQRFREGMLAFSLFAFLYSLLLGITFIVVRPFFNLYTALVIVLFMDVFLTRGFHHDALADTADGIFSSRQAPEMLRIMKDSRVGSNGVIALIFYFLLFILIGNEVIATEASLFQETLALISVFFVSRGALCFGFHHYKYRSHTPKGLGAILIGIPFKSILIAQAVFLVGTFLLTGISSALAYLLVIGFVECYRQFIFKKIGGFNGDTTGTICLISQIVYLFIWIVMKAII